MGAALLRPKFMPLHKCVKTVTSCDSLNRRVVTAYIDGSICLWDTITSQPLMYFLTELAEIRVLLGDEAGAVVVVGLDRLHR